MSDCSHTIETMSLGAGRARRMLPVLAAAAWIGIAWPATASQAQKAELYQPGDRAKDLVVWITGEGDGSGVVFHLEGTVAHVMTARHVVWQGLPASGRPLPGLKARFRPWPHAELRVESVRPFDWDFAAFEVDLAPLRLAPQEILRVLPFEVLGAPELLDRGDGTYPVGQAAAGNWLSPNRPVLFHSFAPYDVDAPGNDVLRLEYHCPRGHSGGAVFDEEWRLVGITLENDAPFCRALRVDSALSLLRRRGAGISLRKPVDEPEPGPILDKEIKVAVVGFDNRSGKHLPDVGYAAQDVLSSFLVNLPRVTVLSRDRLPAVRREQELRGTEKGAAGLSRLGRMLDVDAVVTGSVLRYDVEQKPLRAHGVRARIDIYRMDISLMMIDVETAQIRFARTYKIEKKWENAHGPTVPRSAVSRESELLELLLEQARDEIRGGLTNLASGVRTAGQLVGVRITSEPPQAEVLIKGVHKGVTPLALELEIGLVEEIEVVRPGYETWRRRIQSEPGLEVHANLVKRVF